jgi:hypothetical protein
MVLAVVAVQIAPAGPARGASGWNQAARMIGAMEYDPQGFTVSTPFQSATRNVLPLLVVIVFAVRLATVTENTHSLSQTLRVL